ncbi:LamG domain-containing protein [Candidatus Roizmanbacteria bacterium]|nr:LamG domain-containing protein [Candidatus Roizmanbacteria bacterium]
MNHRWWFRERGSQQTTPRTYLKDISGKYNHATPKGSTVTSGYYGNGRSFNGSTDYIEVESSTSLNLSNVGAVEAWVKLANNWSAQGAVVAKGAFNTNDETYGLYVGSDKIPHFYLKTGSTAVTVDSTETLQTGLWYHLAGTWDGTLLRVYVNGVSRGYKLQSFNLSAVASNTVLRIGRSPDLTGNYFNGLIDEVRVSNASRSSDELLETTRAGRDHRLSKTIPATNLSASIILIILMNRIFLVPVYPSSVMDTTRMEYILLIPMVQEERHLFKPTVI